MCALLTGAVLSVQYIMNQAVDGATRMEHVHQIHIPEFVIHSMWVRIAKFLLRIFLVISPVQMEGSVFLEAECA